MDSVDLAKTEDVVVAKQEGTEVSDIKTTGRFTGVLHVVNNL